MSRFILPVAVLILISSAGWTTDHSPDSGSDPVCEVIPIGPDYYQIDLVTTRKVSGARLAKGFGDVTYAHSPFGVAISPTGTYVYDISVQMSNVTLAEGKSLAAWVTTPQLDSIKSLGRLDEDMRVRGQTDWNKFLLVITLEPDSGPLPETWSGPIVSRGMSRSGLMHTMAGHGPFETEPCAVFGY